MNHSTPEHPPPPSRQRMFEALLIFFSLAVGYGFSEIGFRLYKYYGYAVKADYPVQTLDARQPFTDLTASGNLFGPYSPDTTFTYSFYNADGQVELHHKVRINNLGWVSGFDYTPAPQRAEFRIAIVGASLTVSVTNSLPWPDLLQENLNADKKLLKELGVERISVLNISAAGAGLQYMAFPFAKIASRFTPDLYIVNFSTLNLHQRNYPQTPAALAAAVGKTHGERKASGEPVLAAVEQRIVKVGEVEIPIYCTGRLPGELPDSDCKVSPQWTVPDASAMDKEKLNSIKRQAASALARHRILFSTRPLLFHELMNAFPIFRLTARMEPSGAVDGKSDFAMGLESLNYIRSLAKRMLVIHNPTQEQLARVKRPNGKTDNEVLTDFSSYVRAAEYEILSMEDYLPVQLGEQEWAKWYNRGDDHHWSDNGARVYAAAVARVIHERLLGTKAAPIESASYQKVRDLLARSDSAAAVVLLNGMLAADGNNTHFLTLRGRAYAALGEDSKAEVDLTKALNLLRDADQPATWVELLVQRADIRAHRQDLKGALTDYSAAAILAPRNQQIFIAQGNAHLAASDPKAAAADYEHALTVGVPTPSLYFQLWQARTADGNHEGAVEAATAAIALDPNNPDLYLCRGTSYAALKRQSQANKDFEKMKSIKAAKK
jgi:tetratricopeptide (TPR) repeat protein